MKWVLELGSHTKLEEEEEAQKHTTQEVVLLGVQVQRLDSPRMMGVYTMHGGKNLLVREKVPRRS